MRKHHLMQTSFNALLLSLCLAGTTLASPPQKDSDKAVAFPNSVYFLFENHGFGSTEPPMFGFSYERQISTNYGIHAKLNLATRSEDSDYSTGSVYTQYPQGYETQRNEKLNLLMMDVACLFVLYPVTEGVLRPSFAVGPRIGYGIERQKYNRLDPFTQLPDRENRDREYWLGSLELIFGIHWYLAPQLALHTSYGFRVTSNTYRDKSNRLNTGASTALDYAIKDQTDKDRLLIETSRIALGFQFKF